LFRENSVTRLFSILPLVAVAMAAGACCPNGKCFKEPPCRPCENPCCLTPIQKAALKKTQHALVAPVAYTYEEKTYVFLTESGLEAFHKEPSTYHEKEAVRRIRKGKTVLLDLEPGKDVDVSVYAANARPYVPPPKPPTP
jgi:hypothetical protein